MGCSVGVAKSSLRDARDAGKDAARRALEAAGSAPSLVLVFATVGYKQQALLEGIVSVIGRTPMVGCSGAGIITQEGSDETAFAVAVMALAGDGLSLCTVVRPNVSSDPRGAAGAIADAVDAMPEAKLVLLFPDGIKADATTLLEELNRRLPSRLPVLGGAAGEVMAFDHTYQYHHGSVLEDSVVGAVIGGAFELDFVVSHGCSLLPQVHEVTSVDGPIVRELDGKPAWEVMKEYVADPSRGFHWTDIPYLSVARALPKKPNGESVGHVIRAPFGYDAASGGLVFPGRLSAGDLVTIVRRDAHDIATNSIEAATALGQRHAKKRPALALHFDCAGRGAQLYGDRTTRDLTDPVQRALGKDVPWIGFHCYGEIAPIGEMNYFHQYTMALAAIYEAGDG